MGINDSTVEQVKSAAADNQMHGKLLPRAAPASGDKFEKLTKAMKEKSAHSEYRTAWTNARYNGRRIKRAEEAAAKEKGAYNSLGVFLTWGSQKWFERLRQARLLEGSVSFLLSFVHRRQRKQKSACVKNVIIASPILNWQLVLSKSVPP